MNLKKLLHKNPLVKSIYHKYNETRNKSIRVENVAVFHTGRVGSSVIGDMMNQHPRIFWPGEIFEKLTKSATNEVNQFVYMTIKESQSTKISNIYAFETKFMPEQHLRENCIDMDLETYTNLLKNIEFNKYIIIKRENYLRQLVSVLVGRKKKEWHSKEKLEKITKIKINTKNLQTGYDSYMPILDYFDSIENQYLILEKLLKQNDVLSIIYEKDIENNPLDVYEKVCDFLNVKNNNPKINYKKTNPFTLEQMIENFEEVKFTLKGTKYEWMLKN